MRYLDRFVSSRAPRIPSPHPLSERKLDVARLVAEGLGNRDIATKLFISLSTVKTHLSSVQTKLRLRNRVEIAIWVHENGTADLPDPVRVAPGLLGLLGVRRAGGINRCRGLFPR